MLMRANACSLLSLSGACGESGSEEVEARDRAQSDLLATGAQVPSALFSLTHLVGINFSLILLVPRASSQ